VTDEHGHYEFSFTEEEINSHTNLNASLDEKNQDGWEEPYRVLITLPDGYRFTAQDVGDDDQDSDVDAQGRSASLSLSSDNVVIDAGLVSGDMPAASDGGDGNGNALNADPALSIPALSDDGVFWEGLDPASDFENCFPDDDSPPVGDPGSDLKLTEAYNAEGGAEFIVEFHGEAQDLFEGDQVDGVTLSLIVHSPDDEYQEWTFRVFLGRIRKEGSPNDGEIEAEWESVSRLRITTPGYRIPEGSEIMVRSMLNRDSSEYACDDLPLEITYGGG
jgi:hypothetical protein